MNRLTEKDAYWIGEEFWLSAREPDAEEIEAVYERLKYYEDLAEAGQLVVLPKKLVDKENFIPKLARAFTNLFCPAEFGLNDERCGNWRPYDIIRCYKCWEAALKECNIK